MANHVLQRCVLKNHNPGMRVLVTGGAGFIGNHLALRLVKDGHEVVVVDNVNDYYDLALKEARLAQLPRGVVFRKVDISDFSALQQVFAEDGPFDKVAHLAAQAGVRYSIENPHVYALSNYVGTQNILECAKQYGAPHVVYASTSSVYGDTTEMPFREDARADKPVSIYAASKRSGELVAYAYHDLFDIAVTALRFFTVYGPWGRPDMAPYLFTDAIAKGTPLNLYNHGDMRRDFTYVDDIVDGFVRALNKPNGYQIYNLGCGTPVVVKDFLGMLEDALGKKAQVVVVPMQPGDVTDTFADITKARTELGYEPQTHITEGVGHFVQWYREFYGSV